VQAGDALTTSGVDGVYPPGLPVARVVRVERRSDAGFARILLAPAAAMDNLRHMLVLEPVSAQMPLRPAELSAPEPGGAKAGGRASAAATAVASSASAERVNLARSLPLICTTRVISSSFAKAASATGQGVAERLLGLEPAVERERPLGIAAAPRPARSPVAGVVTPRRLD
jgi:rod shape-determining protein MreC